MTPTLRSMHLHDPVSAHTRKDFSSLRQDMTVQEALAAIRQRGIDCSDPELAALVDEARAHRDECIRAARD